VRLFVAFEVPSALRQEIVARAGRRRERLPRARWLGPEAMHLTLVFLGEVGEERLPALAAAATACLAAETPLRLRVGEAGSFPPGRPARVVWLAVEADREIGALQRRLAAACAAAAGVDPDDKPYHPHLTLARCDPPWGQDEVSRLAAAFTGGVGEPFAVAEAVLFRSHLGGGPARHEALERWTLGAGR
jgi:2'-5' RNA ligase